MADLYEYQANYYDDSPTGHVTANLLKNGEAVSSIELQLVFDGFTSVYALGPLSTAVAYTGNPALLKNAQSHQLNDGRIGVPDSERRIAASGKVVIDKAGFDRAKEFIDRSLDTRVNYALIGDSCVDLAQKVAEIAGVKGPIGALFEPGSLTPFVPVNLSIPGYELKPVGDEFVRIVKSSNPDGPEAEYILALDVGDGQRAAKALVKIPYIYADHIVRLAAGYEGADLSSPSLGGQNADQRREGGATPSPAANYPDPIIRAAATHDSAMDRALVTQSTNPDYDRDMISGVSSAPRQSPSPSPPVRSVQAEYNRDRQGGTAPPDHTATENRRPILLDLDGDGVQITELSRSTRYMDAGGEGLLHRTAWAAAGNGVLFFDPDGRNAITEQRQYVFTEWDPTAQDDLAALRSVWDSNGDGKLTAADTDFAKFKVLVTNADGSTTAQTLAALGITEINLTADATRIELPDGSTITGQTIFTRSNGTTGTVASTGYAADGSVAFVVRSVTSPSGAVVANGFDGEGDDVVGLRNTKAGRMFAMSRRLKRAQAIKLALDANPVGSPTLHLLHGQRVSARSF